MLYGLRKRGWSMSGASVRTGSSATARSGSPAISQIINYFNRGLTNSSVVCDRSVLTFSIVSLRLCDPGPPAPVASLEGVEGFRGPTYVCYSANGPPRWTDDDKAHTPLKRNRDWNIKTDGSRFSCY